MILLDTSGLLAGIDSSQRHHAAAAEALRRCAPPRLLSPFVLAELDYLLHSRVGAAASQALLTEVAAGAYRLEPFGPADVAEALTVLGTYEDQGIGLADASIVVLAMRYGVRDVLTLDEKHFRVMLLPGREPFRILPADW